MSSIDDFSRQNHQSFLNESDFKSLSVLVNLWFKKKTRMKKLLRIKLFPSVNHHHEFSIVCVPMLAWVRIGLGEIR